MKRIFPSTKMVSFRVACRDEKGPVNYFLKLVGLKNLEIIKKNEGIGNKATRFKNKQNKENPILINHKLNPNYDKTIKIFDNDTKFLLTEKELNNNIEEFKKMNNYLLENFGEDFTDNGYPVSEEITSWDE